MIPSSDPCLFKSTSRHFSNSSLKLSFVFAALGPASQERLRQDSGSSPPAHERRNVRQATIDVLLSRG
jgi:hypothetical protein